MTFNYIKTLKNAIKCYKIPSNVAHGFTFIELLFTVTIVAIISALSLAKYNDFTERKKLETDAGKLIDVLELAKKKSVTGDLYAPCTNFQGYSVNITTDSYDLLFYCGADPQTITTNNFSEKNTMLISAVQNIKFAPLTGVLVFGVVPPQDYAFTLLNSQINKSINITVSRIGVISSGAVGDAPAPN